MYKNKKIILLAFATQDLKRSVNRLQKQAEESLYYDLIKIFSPNDFDDKLKVYINNLLKKNKKRGYGFWFWKPYLIKKMMNNINDNDIIHYIDVGCHIIKNKNKKFNEYLNFLIEEKNWILPFQYYFDENQINDGINYPERQEYKYTKADLLKYFNFINSKEITDTPQFWAGNIFIKKNHESKEFLSEWINIMYNNSHLVDDSISKINNHHDFIENRHDQSVFSLLCKKYKLNSFSAYECDWAIKNNKRTWEHNLNSPILAKRDLKYGIMKRFFIRQKKNFNRLIKKI
tara:strand:+ start:685 stop:1548 length:864 start_codon:yes stop_codon:yes gene_type:complete